MTTTKAIRAGAISLALVSCIHNPGLQEPSVSPLIGRVTVSGKVTDSEGGPISGATVAIPGVAEKATSDADGRYTLSGASPGPSGVMVSRAGYATARASAKFSTKAGDGGRNRVDVQLLTPDEIAVLSTRQAHDSAELERIGFLDRQTSAREGYFVTPEQIDGMQPRTISEIFRRVPFVLETNGATSSLLRAARACFVTYLDGLVRHVNAPSELEAYVSPRNVMAVEVYPPGRVPPAAFAQASVRPSCTTVAVWTRS
jgi:hypothetical protein